MLPARVTSKGQVTLPKAVRDALGIEAGDEIIFRVEGPRAVLAPYGRLPLTRGLDQRPGREAERRMG